MTNYCSCGGKVALGTAHINGFSIDQEPFDSGFLEMEENDIDLDEEIISVLISACIKCKKIYSADVNETYDEKYAKVVERKEEEDGWYCPECDEKQQDGHDGVTWNDQQYCSNKCVQERKYKE